MESLKPPKNLKFYQLMKMTTKSGLYFSTVGGSTPMTGPGIFHTIQEAEHHRTLEILKDIDGASNSYHIFELEFPNPAYRE